MIQKVFVSGCFDQLHSGHAAFLKTAASFGDAYVSVARDETITLLKSKAPVNTEAERLFMVKSVRYVKEAWLSSGVGLLDFEADLKRLRPDIFLVNEDGNASEKEALCTRLGVKYLVLKREPEPGLPARSSSALRGKALPYRVEICGAWLDQPFISRLHPGWVVCAQLEPQAAFECAGGGLASSTRTCLTRLQAVGLRRMEPEALARLLFRVENGIDQTGHPVSGAQDALGICVPGVSFQYYGGGYWPAQVESTTDPDTLRWLEAHLSLYPLRPRRSDFDPLRGRSLQQSAAQALSQGSALCKRAIETRSLDDLSESFTLCRLAQRELLPAMFPAQTLAELEQLKASGHFRNWKFMGAGGGGWVLLLDAEDVPGTVPMHITSCNPLEIMV